MQYMKVAGLCLVALLLMSMAVAATATAAPHWGTCEKGASGTKFAEEECGEAAGKGEWAWSEIKGTENSEGRATLLLVDEAIKAEVACTGLFEGSFGPGKYSRIETAKYECTALKGCESGTAKAIDKNLPWQEELFETEGAAEQVTDKGKSEKEEPELDVTCKVLGVEGGEEINATKDSQKLSGRWTIFSLTPGLLELDDIGQLPDLEIRTTAFLRRPAPGPGIRAAPLGPG